MLERIRLWLRTVLFRRRLEREMQEEMSMHLERATEMGRVLCSYDADFLRLARTFTDHAGIVYAQQKKASIGGWVRELRALHARLTAEEVQGQVIFLSGH